MPSPKKIARRNAYFASLREKQRKAKTRPNVDVSHVVPLPYSLMDFPYDIRLIIFKEALMVASEFPGGSYHSEYKGNDVLIKYNNPRSPKVAERDANRDILQTVFPPYTGLDTSRSAIPGSSILLTSKQIHSEAIKLLYSQNHFVTWQPRRFSYLFAPKIGSNIRLIRHLTIGLPIELKHSTQHLLPYLDFFCDKMPGLRCLVLTIQYCPSQTDFETGQDPNQQQRDSLYHTAAWLSLRHPSLRRAVKVGNKDFMHKEGDDTVVLDIKLLADIEDCKVWEGYPPEQWIDMMKVSGECWGFYEKDDEIDCKEVRMQHWRETLNDEDRKVYGSYEDYERLAFLSERKKVQIGLGQMSLK